MINGIIPKLIVFCDIRQSLERNIRQYAIGIGNDYIFLMVLKTDIVQLLQNYWFPFDEMVNAMCDIHKIITGIFPASCTLFLFK